MDEKGEGYSDPESHLTKKIKIKKITVASNYETYNVPTYDVQNPNRTD